jgi:hypothetical protein
MKLQFLNKQLKCVLVPCQCPITSEILYTYKVGHYLTFVCRSLACVLYEMCCMKQAFTGSNFLSIVLKIVEGDTPSLPVRYSRELNTIMKR